VSNDTRRIVAFFLGMALLAAAAVAIHAVILLALVFRTRDGSHRSWSRSA
jgi:hypothetical protein